MAILWTAPVVMTWSMIPPTERALPKPWREVATPDDRSRGHYYASARRGAQGGSGCLASRPCMPSAVEGFNRMCFNFDAGWFMVEARSVFLGDTRYGM